MKDWMEKALKGLIGTKGTKDDNADRIESINQAFEIGKRVANESRQVILDASRQLAEQDKLMEATIIIFVAVWMNLTWAKQGVDIIDGKLEDDPVGRLWKSFEIGMLADNAADAKEKLHKWGKDNGLID